MLDASNINGGGGGGGHWRLPDLSSFQPWAVVSILSSQTALPQLQKMRRGEGGALEPGVNRTLSRLLGALDRLSCAGEAKILGACEDAQQEVEGAGDGAGALGERDGDAV